MMGIGRETENVTKNGTVFQLLGQEIARRIPYSNPSTFIFMGSS